MLPLTGLEPDQIARQLGLKPFQGRQLFAWLHRRRVFDFSAMTNLSKDLRQRLSAECVAAQLQPLREEESVRSPGTKKVLFRLRDKETVESVLIRDRERITICVSTQVGCPVKCVFCATGLTGYVRDLGPGEIAEQVLHLLPPEDEMEGRSPNVVYMGMGEPFRNYENTMASARLLMHGEGLRLGARRITVSTAGDVAGIERFASEDTQMRLSVSLHAANDELRAHLVPLARRYSLVELRETIRSYISRTKRQVTLEWVLIKGVNDSEACAHEFARFASGLNVSANLIPLNPLDDIPYEPPSPDDCRRFAELLQARGLNATLRMERGGDIEAACGQLRRRGGSG